MCLYTVSRIPRSRNLARNFNLKPDLAQKIMEMATFHGLREIFHFFEYRIFEHGIPISLVISVKFQFSERRILGNQF